MRLGPITRALITAVLLMLSFEYALAFDVSSLVTAEREASAMRSDLERVQSVLDLPGVTDEQLADQRTVIEQLRLDSLAEAAKLSAPLDDVKQQLNQLGPAPSGSEKETAAIAVQRADLSDAEARLTAAKKQFELLGVESEQMSGKVSSQQRNQFFQRIFKADKSILNPKLWGDMFTGAALFNSRLGSLLSTWWTEQVPHLDWAGLLLIPAASIVLWTLYRIADANFSGWLPPRDQDVITVSPLRRLWRVIFGALCLFLGLAVIALILVAALHVANLSTPRFDLILAALIGVATPAIFNTGLAYLICSPRDPRFRLISIDARTARTVPIFVLAASLIQSIATQISGLSDALLLPVTLVEGQSALAAAALIGLAGILLFVLKKQSNKLVEDVPEPHYLTWFVSFMPILWLLLLVAVFGLLFGYVALAYFIAGKILDTVLVVVLLVLIHHLIDAVSETVQNPATQLGQKLRTVTAMGEHGIARLSLSFRTIADILLVVFGIPWLLALWTVTWVDFRSFLNNAVVGFRVGNITISPFSILSLLAILAVGIILTRFITRWLDRRILTQTRLNKGVQDSVRTGANYLGYVLAGGFALTAAGFDFSSFAIIAGALGVGIGFGLQSIVNNFVSGLILLAERPIRVGDWVVTSDGEGIVKKINVRATEIETFDNCTIIVPNSNLITNAVRNWTHQDTLGRFLVTVGVAHGSDAEGVIKLLTDIISNHPKVLRYPQPLVQLAKLSSNAMDFELRGHVADVFESAHVASDLRLAIAKEFQNKGYIIPSLADLVTKK
jgi:potassium-dependent mechanosensitive channel